MSSRRTGNGFISDGSLLGTVDADPWIASYSEDPDHVAPTDWPLGDLALSRSVGFWPLVDTETTITSSTPDPTFVGGSVATNGTVEITGWTQIGAMDLNWDRYLKFRIGPDFFSTDLVVIMNQRKWNSLSPKSREILQAAALRHESDSVKQLADLRTRELAEAVLALGQRGAIGVHHDQPMLRAPRTLREKHLGMIVGGRQRVAPHDHHRRLAQEATGLFP